MPMTLTGTFDRKNIENTFEGYETVTNGYMGYDSSNSHLYRIYYQPAEGDAFETAEEVTELRIRMGLKKRTDETSGAEIYLHTYERAVIGENEIYEAGTCFNRIGNYSAGSHAITTQDGTAAQEVVFTTRNTAEIDRIQAYGVGLMAGDDLFQITSCVMEVDVISVYTPPEITLNNGFGKIIDGKYWHYPWNEFTMSVGYSQEKNSPMWRVRMEYTSGSYTRTFYSTNESTLVPITGYVTVPISVWKNLPKSGTLKIIATSYSGTDSNAIEIPFEVAMYTIAFTSHTSGSIVPSDDDIVITWAPEAPTVPSGLILSKEPTQYIRYIWWDDGEPTSGTYTTDTSYTIPASELEGHTALHIAVPEVYGDYGQRDRENAVVLNLYIQQVAGVNEVTVSPLDGNGKIINQFAVSWTSSAQAAYQVQVGDLYDSGVIWGTATTHRVQRFFGFGAYQANVYPVRIRIQDANGIWTDWTEPVYVQRANTSYGNGPEITAVPSVDGVTLRVDTSEYYRGDPTKLLIYRNGRQIAQLLPNGGIAEYVDRNANGIVEYTAYLIPEREWEESGTCWDCAPVTVDATPKTDGLFLADGTWVPLRYTSAAPRAYRTNVSEETYAKYYAGRSYPVYMRSGRKMRELTMVYTDKGNDLADTLEEAVGQMVCWKNRLGQVIHGELNGVSAVRGRISCEVSFVIAQADFTDEIPYTW